MTIAKAKTPVQRQYNVQRTLQNIKVRRTWPTHIQAKPVPSKQSMHDTTYLEKVE